MADDINSAKIVKQIHQNANSSVLNKSNKIYSYLKFIRGFQVTLVVKNLPASAGDMRDMDSIPGSGRFPEGGNGNPFQYSCLENPMDRGAWWGYGPQGHKELDMTEVI